MQSFIREFKLIIIGAAMLILAVAGLWIANRQSDTEIRNLTPVQKTAVPQLETKTYTDQALGFSFKYAKDWGSVEVGKGPRIDKKYESVLSYFIAFTDQPDFMIKITPSAWTYTGGNLTGDVPLNPQIFQQNYSVDTSILQIMQTGTGYLNMAVDETEKTVTMKGAKQINLTKIPANYVEFVWEPVSASCAVEMSTGAKRATASCYPQADIDETKVLLDNFNEI